MKAKRFLCAITTIIIALVSFVVPVDASSAKIDVPENIKAIVKTDTSVKVSWDAVKNADYYLVYYSTEKNDGYTSYGKTTQTYATVKQLNIDTKYYFRVRAVQTIDGKKIKSRYSKSANATPQKNEKSEIEYKISVIQKPGDVQNGRQAELIIKGKPNTLYECVVYYDTINGTAKGIGTVLSDSDGYAKWEWKVGTRTYEGEHEIGIFFGSNEIRRLKNIFFTHKKK